MATAPLIKVSRFCCGLAITSAGTPNGGSINQAGIYYCTGCDKQSFARTSNGYVACNGCKYKGELCAACVLYFQPTAELLKEKRDAQRETDAADIEAQACEARTVASPRLRLKWAYQRAMAVRYLQPVFDSLKQDYNTKLAIQQDNFEAALQALQAQIDVLSARPTGLEGIARAVCDCVTALAARWVSWIVRLGCA